MQTMNKKSAKNLKDTAEANGDCSRTSPEGAEEIRVSDVIEQVPLDSLVPAYTNNIIYKPVSTNDPAIIKLAQSIREKGLLQPIVVTEDNVIISGHRRRAACEVAGLEVVPVQRINLRSDDPRFESYLVTFNEQRVKSPIEQIREEVARTSPGEALQDLLNLRGAERSKSYRRVQQSGLRILAPTSASRRSDISAEKQAMLGTIVDVIYQYEDFWPLTVRQIHYRLLTRNVFRNTKTGLRYTNTQQSYKDLSDLLTRARHGGRVPWESIHDPTRPRCDWRQWDNVAPYMREQLDSFLGDYRRNLIQSQPAHIELMVEKITVQDIAERAAGPFQIPVGVGRGYTSVTSLWETGERFHDSGKDHFILLIAGDLDPEGENICQTWDAQLRDEHRIESLEVVKVGVNPDQIATYSLSPLPIKEKSSRAAGFKATHGSNVYELEAFEPVQLQRIIRDAILSVLDMGKFEEERKRQAEEARTLMACRKQVQGLLKGCDFGEGVAPQ
jgi:hypothetical protein